MRRTGGILALLLLAGTLGVACRQYMPANRYLQPRRNPQPASLADARKAREGALMGGIAAGETLVATAEALGQKRHELGQVETLRQLASQRGEQLLSLLLEHRPGHGRLHLDAFRSPGSW